MRQSKALLTVDRKQESLETGCVFMCTSMELYDDRIRCQLERHIVSNIALSLPVKGMGDRKGKDKRNILIFVSKQRSFPCTVKLVSYYQIKLFQSLITQR